MSAMQFLDQLFKSGSKVASGVGQTAAGHKDLLTGVAAGGVLGLLLGTQRGRSLGGSALKLGSVAVLGAVAYEAYNEWQASKQLEQDSAATPRRSPLATRQPAPSDAEARARALLASMIAAAKSDGHLDERERGMLDAEVQRVDADPALKAWMDAELRRPVDPADVARAATTPEMAAEMYLASLIVVDDRTIMERAYLDQLALELQLAPELKADLEARAAKAAAA
jgi:uncharacterized membrane protein YebE (DUF533 family)